jgi:hypothetical protein
MEDLKAVQTWLRDKVPVKAGVDRFNRERIRKCVKIAPRADFSWSQ